MENTFEPGDYVWITSWDYADIKPQIGMWIGKVRWSDNSSEIAIFDDHTGKEGVWFFYKTEFRRATEKEIEEHLKSQMCEGVEP